LPRQCGGVAAIGQLAPQEQAGFRLQPRRDAQRLQFPQRVPACIGQARTYRLHVAAVAAVGQRDVHQLRGQMATAEAGRQLQVGQCFDPVMARSDVAAARGCRQRLGETADVDHP
jgi:hypothetical protein